MKVCHICNMDSGKHLLGCWSVGHIKDGEQQLAAANARIAKLEAEIKTQHEVLCYQKQGNDKLRDELEQAEAQCAYWENKYKEIENGQ